MEIASIADTAGAVPLDITAAGVEPDDPAPSPDMHPKASPFALAADALWAGGYTVIPVVPRDKAPGDFRGSLENGSWGLMTAWNDYAHSRPHESMLTRWKTWPDANIGVVLGGNHNGYALVAIDFDTDRDDELELLASSIPPSPMRKAGSRGFTAFYRASPDVKTKRYMVPAPTADKPHAKRTVLEVLTGNAPRQTVMPPSMHPHGRAYEYTTGNGVVPIHKLPVLTQDHFDVLEDNLGHIGWNGDDIERVDRATRGAMADDDNIWRETNNVAVENLDMWVGALGLPKLKRHGNGSWEAIPSFRASGTGVELMRRKSNLKFHRSGIKDMGTDIGYTAIDVVVAAFSWDFDSAFQWLRGKLGLKGEDDDFFALPKPPRRILAHDDGALFDAETGEIIGGANDNTAPRDSDAFPDHLTRPPGTFGAMIEYVVATAPKPSRALATAACIVALGSLCSRRDETPTNSGTVMYVIGLAVTGGGKQQPQDAGEAMVRAATMDRGDDIMGPSDLMSEGALINEIKYRPHSCSYIDEFGDLVAKMNAFGSKSFETGIKKTLLQIWGKPYAPWKTPSYAKIRGVPIHSPAFSLFGASTPNKFYEAMSGEDRENGFLNRFLIIPETAKVKSVDPEFDWRQVPPELAEKLRAIYEIDRELIDMYDADGRPLDDPWNASVEPRRRHIGWANDEAKAVYDHFRAECDEAGHFFARSAEMAGRIATIVAVGREWEHPSVSIDDIVYGVELARWSAEHMAKQASDHVTSGVAGAERSKILRKVQQSGGRVAQSEVMKHLGYTAKALEEHVRDMGPDGTGQLVVEAVAPAGGGKPKRYLRLADR